MAGDGPSKNDIELIFKRLQSVATNKSCFDCNAKNPTWSSVTYGIFICIDCSAVHRSLGVHLTFVRSTQLDTNWTWLQIRQMQLGGNANALQFFRQHNCTTTDAQMKYNSRVAQMYRDKLHAAAVQAMKIHGTKLHIDSYHTDNQNNQLPEKKEVDFFDEHTSFSDSGDTGFDRSSFNSNFQQTKTKETPPQVSSEIINNNVSLAKGASLSKPKPAVTGAPSVGGLLSTSVSADQDRKPTIGTRKPQPKRAGLGAKKGGLGAQKVKGNFEDLAREAELADQRRSQEAATSAVPVKNPEEEEAQLASMRLAYQDLSIKQKREEEKLKAVDPKKAQQVERLGMGFSTRSEISHSALTDMKTIVQEDVPYASSKSKSSKSKSSMFDSDNDGFFDDFSNFSDSKSSTNFSMHKNNSFPPSLNQTLDSMFFDTPSYKSDSNTLKSIVSSSCSPSSSCWEPVDRHNPSSKKPTPQNNSSNTSSEAQKKFGSAKAISSDQYFGDSQDNSWEQKSNLSRFEGSSSISSADYFGRTEIPPGGGLQAPDLEDVKESVRQGVTKVAGKLSLLANGVMSSISDKYSGGY